MAEYTSGEWVEGPRYGNLKTEIVAGGLAIATVWTHKNRDELSPEGMANFRLMKAAPLLLEACEYWLHEGRFWVANCDEYNTAIEMLRAAIAAARGES